MPLFGGTTNQPTKLVRYKLGNPRNVLTEFAQSFRWNRRRENRMMAITGSGVAGTCQQNGSCAERQRGGAGWDSDFFAEQVGWNAIVLNITIAQQADNFSRFDGRKKHGAGLLVEGCNVYADRPTLLGKPFKEFRWVERFGHCVHGQTNI
jgi:hypothetical protein